MWRFVTTPAYRHVAITVPDLESAEAYYRGLFDLEVITREALTADGDRQLPPDKDWPDARAAGVDLYMVGLRRGDFVLALFDEASAATAQLGRARRRPLFIGLVMSAAEIAALQSRLGAAEAWDENSGGFRDRYGIVWQPAPHTDFVGSGASGRWLTAWRG